MPSDNVFSGLKVVDFASFVAAPGAAVILSDFGADVIKVEPPSGDPWRHAHKIPPQPVSDEPYQWHLANRNKRSITLDLKSPNAQQVLKQLVKWADVLIVNTPHPARRSHPEDDRFERSCRCKAIARSCEQGTGYEPERGLCAGSLLLRAVRRDGGQEGGHVRLPRKARPAVPGAVSTTT